MAQRHVTHVATLRHSRQNRPSISSHATRTLFSAREGDPGAHVGAGPISAAASAHRRRAALIWTALAPGEGRGDVPPRRAAGVPPPVLRPGVGGAIITHARPGSVRRAAAAAPGGGGGGGGGANGEEAVEEARGHHPLWERFAFEDGRPFYINMYTQRVTLQCPLPRPCLGGILADEMGMGKTSTTPRPHCRAARRGLRCGASATLVVPRRGPRPRRWAPTARTVAATRRTPRASRACAAARSSCARCRSSRSGATR